MKKVMLGEAVVALNADKGGLHLSVQTMGPTLLFALKPECPMAIKGEEELSEGALHILKDVAMVIRESADLGDPVATGCAQAETPSNHPVEADDFLVHAERLLGERGKEYDRTSGNKAGRERSGGRVAEAFNAITGKDLTAAEVYLLLQCVKDVRQWSAPAFHPDSAVDSVAFAALKSEALAQGV